MQSPSNKVLTVNRWQFYDRKLVYNFSSVLSQNLSGTLEAGEFISHILPESLVMESLLNV